VVHYYFANHLGSATVVTSSAGVIQDESDFYPFGGERIITDTDPNAYKFTGKERDSESGLDFFIARYYSSGYGRLTSPDEPFVDQNPSDPQSWNLFSFVRNNPAANVDLDGRSCVTTTSKDKDGKETTNQSDDGDGKGCAAAGVKPSKDQNNPKPEDIEPQQTQVNEPPPSFLESLFASPVDRYVENDVPLSPSGQQAALAIHNALEKLPAVCSVGASVRFGAGRVQVGFDLNSSAGLRRAARAQVVRLGLVSGNVSTNEFGHGVSANVSVRIPGTPASVGVSTADGSRISSVNVGLRTAANWVNITAYANLGQTYSCK